MFQNYVRIAVRHVRKRAFYSGLNIIGLAAGITFALLIGSYVWGEYRVNRTLRHAGQQCLVQSRWTMAGMGMDITTLAPIGPALKAQYPALVANYYRFYGVSATLSKGSNHFRESIQIGDATLLTMFGFDLLHGNPRTALTGPNAIVITAAKALKYFGRTDVLNQSLTVETPQSGRQSFLVTGVLKPLPANSVTNLLTEVNEVFMSVQSVDHFGQNVFSWQNQYIVNYVELQPGIRPEDLQKPLARLIATNTPPAIAKHLTARLTPLPAYYLQSNNGLVRRVLVTLLAVGGFILLMAIVNFINLSLGGSSSRLREIGVRKVLGGIRPQLTVQFLVEALVLTGGAVLLSLGLYPLLRPLFGTVVGKEVLPLTGLPGSFFGWLAVLTLLVGVLAGSYPALYLSAYSTMDSLRGKARSIREGQLFRRALVTGQFAIAAFVFVGAIVVSRQIDYFFTTDLGFTKDALLTVSSLPRNWTPDGVARMQAARDRFARLPGIESASVSYEIPNGNVGNSGSLYADGKDSTQAVSVAIMTTDEQFARTYRIALRAGRYFQAGGGSYDSTSLVLNEAATKALGYKTPEAAVGQQVHWQGFPRAYRVQGVVRNFHVGTLHQAIRPLAIGQVRAQAIYRFFSFRLAPGNPRQTISGIEQTWHEQFPDAPLDYTFMDNTLQTLYRTELQLEKAGYVATALALLIVLLGVVGLVSLSVVRRTKEVGVRKVLGASVPQLIGLFLTEYAWIMLLANAVAWPVAYYVLTDWLAGYAYHTRIGWTSFAGVGLVLAGLTGAVVTAQSIRAALMNPVKSLRSE